jgi:hypothetical protein
MITKKNNISGSQWWINSENLSLPQILMESGLPDKWSKYNSKEILNIKSILKPINNYVLNLYPKPEIINITNNIVTFRQRTHAEIWVEERKDGTLYALDKCHQRQFYPSLNNLENKECFDPTYKFYIPWFINKNVSIKIARVEDEPTPFYIGEKNIIGKPLPHLSDYAYSEFVDFKIKNTGEYYLKEKYAIISKSTAMYDMSVVLSDEEISQIKDYYGQQ